MSKSRPLLRLLMILAAIAAAAAASAVERLTVEVVARHPHDPTAYTQGLLYADGALFESTGLEGASTLRLVELETGHVASKVALDASEFGEGLAVGGDRLVQLTWKNGKAHIYDRTTLARTGGYTYQGEGWGLTHDGGRFIMSDGSAVLQIRDTTTFDLLATMTVTGLEGPLGGLNELEWADGALYANIFRQDRIVRIDPATGRVTAEIDASSLRRQLRGRGEVLNGIAHRPGTDRFLVTGKLWPTLFEVRFVAPAP